LRASVTITAIIVSPTIAAGAVKPQCAINSTHSGENTTPPMLAPL
jgi:hypothetical protein